MLTKKEERIINSVLNPTKENLSKVGHAEGYWYAMDGFRLVRFEQPPNELPIFEENEQKPNYKYYFEDVANKEIQCTQKIPYSVEQIKAWSKTHKGMAFELGVMAKISSRTCFWLGINPKFLVDAMTTTGSNEIKIPSKGAMLIIEGNGFTWLVMGIRMKTDQSIFSKMTIINE